MVQKESPNIFEYYSKIESREVEWLWYPYIPYGKITLVQGDPGEGKSTFIIELISILTNGNLLPDKNAKSNEQVVIYQCSEDSKADTIKPRLQRAKANCDRVVFIPEDDKPITLCDERLEKVIMDSKARLLVFDPIQSFIPADTDMQNALGMRRVMQSLTSLAERTGCAIILVGHMNKSSGGKNIYRGLGSIDITATARSVLMIERDHNDSQIRYMYPIKTSLAPEGDAIAFQMDPENGFHWIGKCDYCQNDEPNHTNSTKICQAKELLSAMLEEEDLPTTEILFRMKSQHISEKTTRNAQKQLGIKSYKNNNSWYWHLVNNEGGE